MSTSTPVPMALIVLDGITAEQRQEVHEVITANANGWWHHFENVWIAGGHTCFEWRALVSPIVTGRTGEVIVFELPRGNRWSGFGPSGPKYEWLKQNLA